MTRLPRARALSLLASIFALGAVLAMPTTASAHSELLDESPAPGSTLKKAPSEVVLDFNEPVQEQSSSIVVETQGVQVTEDGNFQVRGTTASNVLIGDLGSGTYDVSYRIVSEDGHIVSDEYSFKVVDGPVSTPPSDAPSSGSSPVSSEESDESTGTVVWVLGLGAIGLVLIAALIAVAVRGRRGRSS